ncbi:T9SS type A sorting domain-containing protein [Roseivirga sp.]
MVFFNSESGNKVIEIDLSNRGSGIYLVAVDTGQGVLKKKVMIKR